MADEAVGPSGGVLGERDGDIQVDQGLVGNQPDLARRFLTFGKHSRAGHDRARWATVNWQDYQAQVGLPAREGPWHVTVSDSTEGTVSELVHRWVSEAEEIPWEPGIYPILEHDQRGLVMSDLPAEICGALPFLDHVATLDGGRILIAGLGLGIVPAWLLDHATVARIDVIEIDKDLIRLITRDAHLEHAPNAWAADPRLHIHHADAHTWWPAGQRRTRHSMSRIWPGQTWDATWLDIWDLISQHNLPSMDRLEARYGPWSGAIWSWERPECEAMLARGQTIEAPNCWVDETGYPTIKDPAGE